MAKLGRSQLTENVSSTILLFCKELSCFSCYGFIVELNPKLLNLPSKGPTYYTGVLCSVLWVLLPLSYGVSTILEELKLLPFIIEFLTVACSVLTALCLPIGVGFSPLTRLTLFVIRRSGLFGGRVSGRVISSCCVFWVCSVVDVTRVRVLCIATVFP